MVHLYFVCRHWLHYKYTTYSLFWLKNNPVIHSGCFVAYLTGIPSF